MVRTHALIVIATLAMVTAAAPAVAEARPDLNARLDASLRRASSWRQVRREVIAWHHTTRNGCVAFVSTALRRLDVDIPQRGYKDGDPVSRITRGLVRYLELDLGWRRVDGLDELVAGDIAFTTDVACCPGYPAHVFVFHRWRDRRRRLAVVSDNQGHRQVRPLTPPAGSSVDPFAFALRAPPPTAD